MRLRKYNLIELKEQRLDWQNVCLDYLDEEKRKNFENKKIAVDMYIEGHSLKQITKVTNLSIQVISKLVGRCVAVDNRSGMQFGYCGLLPYKRVNSDKLQLSNINNVKTRGAFKTLLIKYPALKKMIEDIYFNNKKVTLEKNIRTSDLHKIFLEECRKLNIQDYEYPFNTFDNAKRTFYNYLKNIEIETPDKAINRQNMNAKQKYNSTGKGQRVRINPINPYSVVQIDGHKIDMIYSVEVRNKHGEIELMPALRMWLIAVMDVSTRTIIGYSLSTNENYNQTDILRAIKNSIIPKIPITFSIGNLGYPDNFGFPSLAIDSLGWAMFDTIMLDNAKSHLATNVINKLSSTLYCSLNFGAVSSPETRGIIERVFKTLEKGGYHRTPSTTGSNIKDPKRNKAEENAVKYGIKFSDIAELTEYFIAIYNNSPHSYLDNQTPLQCLKRRVVDAGMKPHIADDAMKEKINALTYLTELKTIRGSATHGKRPYISYKGVEYRNDILSQSMGLIGNKIIIEINPDDIRTLTAYFEDGSYFGILIAVGDWGRVPHSLKTREEANKLANENRKNGNSAFYAPLAELEKELNERSIKNIRARTKAARIRTEQKKKLELTNSTEPILNSDSIAKKNIQNEKNFDKEDSYTQEELNAILSADSIEEAFIKGLL